MSENKKNYHIFSGSKFIESMRSGGYKDTSYAVAEIVDNAIDAGARHVEIMCQDKINHTGRNTLDKIAILDDGQGMNSDELRSALLFGDGTRGSNSKDIGKYGMGLPNSSLSQCKRVDVYTWQNNSEPIHCHMDVDEVKKGKTEISKPEIEKIPKSWIDAANNLSKQSGTLVIWSKLDRCSWTTSKKVLEHSTYLIGRIYRKFLAQKDITIDMIRFKEDDSQEVVDKESNHMLPNDPLYLMAPSSTPGKWAKEAMFKPDTNPEERYSIRFDEKIHEIVVRYSIEKDELRAREHKDQGFTDHGNHAGKNEGISIIRADREIQLDNFGIPNDPRHRWWGVEIDIPHTIDLLVGLTNNKQHVVTLATLLRATSRAADDISRNMLDEEEEGADVDKARIDLIIMCRDIHAHIRSMASRIRATRAGIRTSTKKNPIDEKIEAGIEQAQKEGKISHSEKDRKDKTKEQRIIEITERLEQEGKDNESAKKTAEQWVNSNKGFDFVSAELDGGTFFSAENIGGIMRVKINSKHRAYKNLILLTDSNEHEYLTNEERLELTKDGLMLLLASWVRFEDLIENDKRREDVQNIRIDWGRELNTFLDQNAS